MARDQRKDDRENRSEDNAHRFNPHAAESDELADVDLADADEAERGGLGLLEKGQKGVEGVVRREEEVGGNEEWEDDLGGESVTGLQQTRPRRDHIDSMRLSQI
jgi:hypothetical protein